MRSTLISLSLILFCFISQSQGRFRIMGKILTKEVNKVELIYIMKDSTFNVDNKIISIAGNSSFTFNGFTPYPYAAYFLFNDSVRSNLFFIDSGNTNVSVRGFNEEVALSYKIDAEYRASFLPLMTELKGKSQGFVSGLQALENVMDTALKSKKEDSLRLLIRQNLDFQKNYLRSFIEKNTGSYISLWLLYFDLIRFGYSQKLHEAFRMLTADIKSNPIGKAISTMLVNGLRIEVGRPFPKVELLSFSSREVEPISLRSKFTFIDFWYSNCAPCLAQFPELKKIYSEYSREKFDIIGISVDSDQQLWSKTIANRRIPWTHYLDLGGVVTGELSIFSFPTNFLLDSKGNIVKKDIGMDALKELLK